ncbi:MAG: hypothetical protein KC421_02490 [Anaerolineales bacterium]|nr:hypothetical protein [Anaerolineales bacterium]
MKQNRNFSLSTDLPEQIAMESLAIAQALGLPVETDISTKAQYRAAALSIPIDLNRKPEIYCGGRSAWCE